MCNVCCTTLRKDIDALLLLSCFANTLSIHLHNHWDSFVESLPYHSRYLNEGYLQCIKSEQLSPTASQVKITFVVTFDIVMTTLISNGEIVIDCFLLTKLKKEMLDRLRDWKLAPMGSTAWNLGISMHLVLQMEKLTKLNWHKFKKKIYGSCKSFQKIHCC